MRPFFCYTHFRENIHLAAPRSRSWLLYPNFNYLSWGWAAALLASWALLASAGLFLVEARAERVRKADNEELLFQLEPGHIFSTHSSGII